MARRLPLNFQFSGLNPKKSPFSWTCALFLRPRSTPCCDTPRAVPARKARAAPWRSGGRSADSAPRRNGRGPGSWAAGGSARSCFDGSWRNSKYSLSVGVWSCRDNWDLRFITPVTNQESLYNPLANLSGGGKRGTSGNFIATSHGSFMGKNELSHVTCRFHHEKRCI